MAVSLIPKFNRNDIAKMLAEKYTVIDQALLLRILRVGEAFVKQARDTANFKDRTGNLRSSIGYIILKDGKDIYENFKSRAGGKDGVEKAREVAAALKIKYPKGYVLIAVAGMDYAAAVESLGYDVITSSAADAATNLKQSLSELAKKLK